MSCLRTQRLTWLLISSLCLLSCADESADDPSDSGLFAVVDARHAQDQALMATPDAQVVRREDVATIPVDPMQSLFSLPIHPQDRGSIQASLVIGVDHDPASDGALVCRSFDGRSFPACYDGHDGTDFIVWGGFDTIDAEDVRVIAAAPGVVIRVEDGNYDRCHGDFGSSDVSCDGHPIRANRVHVRHEDGLESRYLHLKRGSIVVDEGDTVACGDIIAFVGSSGRSTAPHLHFELVDSNGSVVDPFAGPVTRVHSYWTQQDTGDGLPGEVCTR